MFIRANAKSLHVYIPLQMDMHEKVERLIVRLAEQQLEDRHTHNIINLLYLFC